MPRPARKVKRAHSAGGVVFRRSSSETPDTDFRILLLQHETGKWMLPKGTIEAGETPEAVALREVAEETGLRNVRIVADLGEERYVFFWKVEDTYYDKTVHYYLMESLGDEEAVPQREEGFVKCEWVMLPEALERIKYKETRQVVHRAQAVLDAGRLANPQDRGRFGMVREHRDVTSPVAAGLPSSEERAHLVQQTLERYRRYLNPGLARLFRFGGSETVEWAAEGCRVWDVHGREYIDCACGPAIFNVGHRHPRVLAAVRDQLERIPMSVRTMPSAPQAELAERLAALTPGDLQYSFFCNSGAEAIEGALKLARVAMGKPGVIAMQQAFHGKTFGALTATGREYYRKPFEPLVPGFTHVPYGDPDAVEAALGPDTAAVLLEPIQGEAGVVIPPSGYLRRIREICDRHGVLMIADEIQTGLGRTGRLFCVEHEDTTPDIMTLAKALGGGVMPIGAFIARPQLWEEFRREPYLHSSTFGGNPLACRAALATLDVLLDERLAERAEERGRQFLDRLQGIQARHPQVITAVRGRGLMIGVEFSHSDYALLASAEAGHRGVITFYTLNNPQVIRIEPPLIITADLVDGAAVGIEEAVGEAERLLGHVRA